MQLLSYREVPPGYYRYVPPETGVEITAWDADAWVRKAREHLQANNIPVPIDLQAQMEDQLCQVLPPGWCQFDDPSRPRVDTRLSWGDVEAASSTFGGWVSEGRPLVEQTEAERRAKICANCYLNTRATGCGMSCRALLRTLFGLLTSRKTSVDDRLQSCAACKCLLRLKVHFPLTLIEQHDKRDLQMLLPNWCWLKQDGDNYRP